MTSPQFAARVDARPAKDGWLARCPGHDDHRSSLTIGSGHDGRVLLKCHAGCTPETIVAAAGLTLQDLFPVKPVKKKNGIVATYDYRDAAGGLQYQVVRYDPKDFRHRRPDGNGGWIWNLERVPRVLFGLPDLPAQLTHVRQKVVYIVEGEKDVLRLRDLGIIATTNAGGASKNPKKPKWRAEYTAQLQAAGARAVYIPPDNDDPGRAHAEAVAQSCSAAGLSVKVLTLPDLPPKGDVSDWFAAGQTRRLDPARGGDPALHHRHRGRVH